MTNASSSVSSGTKKLLDEPLSELSLVMPVLAESTLMIEKLLANLNEIKGGASDQDGWDGVWTNCKLTISDQTGHKHTAQWTSRNEDLSWDNGTAPKIFKKLLKEGNMEGHALLWQVFGDDGLEDIESRPNFEHAPSMLDLLTGRATHWEGDSVRLLPAPDLCDGTIGANEFQRYRYSVPGHHEIFGSILSPSTTLEYVWSSCDWDTGTTLATQRLIISDTQKGAKG
ncbi:hypothetical protein MVEN_00034000 [Mycena venus]|uniref:Uncharacterized protein n=1 Tax=Mycena venus TaxID=2733690 RepID=A0A8H6Z6B9_9AGAR|nr:hypothetical protein MVEN_00034000 [Mycena venus]